MFYYALTFLPIGILIGLFSKKEKPIIDSLLYSSVISACIVFIIALRIIKIDVNIYEVFLFNIVGSLVGTYIVELIKYLSKKFKKTNEENNNSLE